MRIAGAAVIAALLGCGNETSRPSGGARHEAAPQAALVARVNGVGISIEDVARQAQLSRQGARAALEALVDGEVLVQEARRRGFDSSGDILAEGKRAAVLRFLEREFEQPLRDLPVEEAELLARYERAKGRFVRPEVRVVLHALAELPASAAGDRRARARSRAEALAAALAGRDWQPSAFTDLARRPVDAATTLRIEEVRTARVGVTVEEFAKAAFDLPRPGAVSGVVETSFGYHVILLVSVEPAIARPFSDARPEILAEFLQHRAERAFLEFIERLEKRHRVSVDPDALPGPRARGDQG